MVTVRAAEASDVDDLVALALRSWADVEASVDAVLGSPLDRLATPSWSAHHAAGVRAACASPETAVVVAEDAADGIVGFIAHTVHPATAAMSEYGEILVIVVEPDARGHGVGRTLLDRAVADLRERGVPVIMLETGGDDGHAPARALYESAGFTPLPIVQYWLPGRADAATPDDPRPSSARRP